MGDYTVTALTPATWDDFAGLAVQHNGVSGGNWCMAFHGGIAKDAGAAGNLAAKVGLVRAGRAHAALVYAGKGDVSDSASSGRLRTCPGSRIARHMRRCKAGCRPKLAGKGRNRSPRRLRGAKQPQPFCTMRKRSGSTGRGLTVCASWARIAGWSNGLRCRIIPDGLVTGVQRHISASFCRAKAALGWRQSGRCGGWCGPTGAGQAASPTRAKYRTGRIGTGAIRRRRG